MQDNTSLPVGITYSKKLNQFCIGFFITCSVIGFFLALVSIPSFLKSLHPNINNFIKLGVPAFILVFFTGIWLLPIKPLISLNRGLESGDKNARKYQIVWSVLCLLFIPIGTVLYGISLYFMLGHAQTKSYFKE